MPTNYGPAFNHLSPEGKVLAVAWYQLAKASPPDKSEDLPVDFLHALADLARADGSRGKLLRGRQSVKSNRARQVRVRKAVGALA